MMMFLANRQIFVIEFFIKKIFQIMRNIQFLNLDQVNFFDNIQMLAFLKYAELNKLGL